jgi:lipopolysaccharide biosynthesis glycosyltransferase
MGAVDIPGSDQGVRRLGMRLEDGYFNAGVIVTGLKQWRASRAEKVVLDYIRANPERIACDQDALHACFHTRTKQHDYKCNIGPPLERAEIGAIRHDALIIHFNGSSKPWSYFSDHPHRAEYEKYLQMTEWITCPRPNTAEHAQPPTRVAIGREMGVGIESDLTNMLRKGISAVLPDRVKALLKMVAP